MRGPTLWALRASLTCAVCVLGMCAHAPVVAARDVWVDHDSRGGPCDDARTAAQNSMTAPWCTLAAAGNKAEPGDTVRVRGGEYTERHGCGDGCWNLAVLDIVHAGRPDAWIRFVAEPGEDVHITPAGGAVHGILIKAPDGAARNWYVEISGFHISGFSQVDETNGSGICVSLRNAADVTLRNLEVTNCGGGGAIGMHLSGRITVEGCDVHDNHTHGWTTPMNLYRCRPGNVIRGNRIWNNEDDPPDWCRAGGGQCPDSEGNGIIMDYCVENDGGAIIENNVLWDNEGSCIVVFHSDHARIQNNVCYKNARRADGGEISVFGNDVTLFNNIAVPRPGQFGLDMNYDQDSIYRVDESTLYENYNIIWGPDRANIMAYGNNRLVTLEQYRLAVPGGWSSETLFADPMFNNADAHDFTLRAGSPAIDSGDNAHAAAVDITGGARPADGDGNGSSVVDRGAYEIGATASTSTTTRTTSTTTTTITTTLSGSIGQTTIGSTLDSGDSNYLNGSRVTTTNGGSIVSMSVYIGNLGSNNKNRKYRLGIYTDTAGKPGTRVANTATGTLVANSWNTLPINATLQANTSYWLMYNTNGRTPSVNNMSYNDGSTGQGAYSSNTVNFRTWPTTFPAATITSAVYSLYASFGP
jgi:hypothetical protein